MYKSILRSLPDIAQFPVIAFLIFFVFFVVLFFWVLKMDKKRINHLSSLPIDADGAEVSFQKLD